MTTTLEGGRPNIGVFFASEEIRTVSRQEVTLQLSLESTITSEGIAQSAIQVFRSGDPNSVTGVFGDRDEVAVTIGYVSPGKSPNEVVLQFGESQVDDYYPIVVHGTGPNALTVGTQTVASNPQQIHRLIFSSIRERRFLLLFRSASRDCLIVCYTAESTSSASAGILSSLLMLVPRPIRHKREE